MPTITKNVGITVNGELILNKDYVIDEGERLIFHILRQVITPNKVLIEEIVDT